jgi:hypothetical protein
MKLEDFSNLKREVAQGVSLKKFITNFIILPFRTFNIYEF